MTGLMGHGGTWRCSCCGETNDPLDPAWRWTGEAWEHKCKALIAQGGYMPARRFGPATAAPLAEESAHAEEVAKLRAELARATETLTMWLALYDEGYTQKVCDRIGLGMEHLRGGVHGVQREVTSRARAALSPLGAAALAERKALEAIKAAVQRLHLDGGWRVERIGGVVPPGWYVTRPNEDDPDDECERDALRVDGEWDERLGACRIQRFCFPSLDDALAAVEKARGR